jgi:hypothetical protein
MKIAEVGEMVRNEKQIPGRFPTRIVFARNWTDYAALVGILQEVCDVTLNLAQYTTDDIIPKFKELKKELKRHENKTVLLLSLGEYLRLCPLWEKDKSHGEFKGLWEQMQAESATTKYIVPIFGSRELFDNVVTYIGERQMPFLWEVVETTYDSDISLTLYSPSFADAISVDAANFSEWLDRWDTLFMEKRNSFSVQTKLYKYAEGSLDNVRIDVIDEPFTYVVSLASDGDTLKKDYGDDLFWSKVAKYIKANKPFSATIDFALNVGHSFVPNPILASFDQLNDAERRMFWIRHKMYGENDYISFAISKTNKPEEIPLAVRDAVFSLAKPTDVQLSERISAISVLNLHYEDAYFAKLDEIKPAETRFRYLSYKTQTERAYAVKTVSTLLRNGADALATADMLRAFYPQLAEYLSPTTVKTDRSTAYFNWYRKKKLINRIPEDIPPMIDLDSIDSRNKVIQNSGGGYPFWIDGMGVEWLPVLLYELDRLSADVHIAPAVARSVLPSETEYNHQWGKDAEKWDRLDKLSHNGMPDDKDYFSCVAMQLEYISEIGHKVGELLADNNCVIVTGDHGSSRLAALLFHVSDNYAIDSPQKAQVRSYGRFCELADETTPPIMDSEMVVTSYNYKLKKDVKCVVMKTYEHFKQTGNAAGGNTDKNAVVGEVHGGMTPEECLVPVVIVKRKTPLAANNISEGKKRQAATFADLGIG